MDIPDEAFNAFTATWNSYGDPSNREGRAVRSLAAAAPHIARAAQVQVLRELADEFNAFHNDGADPMVERTLRVLILRLHGKANELEQGAP